MSVTAAKPQITSVEQYALLLPEKPGLKAQVGAGVAKVRVLVASAPTVLPSTETPAQALSSTLADYVQKTNAILPGDELATDLKKAEKEQEDACTAFYDAFKKRVAELDCQVPEEDLLRALVTSEQAIQLVAEDAPLRERVVLDALATCAELAAARCAKELFQLIPKESSQVDHKIGLIEDMDPVMKAAKEKCTKFLKKVSDWTVPAPEEEEGEAPADEDEEARKVREEAIDTKRQEKRNKIRLTEADQKKYETVFRGALRAQVQQKRNALQKEKGESRTTEPLARTLKEEQETRKKALEEESKQKQKEAASLRTQIQDLERALQQPNIAPGTETAFRKELPEKKTKLKALEDEIIGLAQQIVNITRPTVVRKYDVAIQNWDAFQRKLNEEFFPESSSVPVAAATIVVTLPEKVEESVTNAAQQGKETARKWWRAGIDALHNRMGPATGTVGRIWNSCTSGYATFKKGTVDPIVRACSFGKTVLQYVGGSWVTAKIATEVTRRAIGDGLVTTGLEGVCSLVASPVAPMVFVAQESLPLIGGYIAYQRGSNALVVPGMMLGYGGNWILSSVVGNVAKQVVVIASESLIGAASSVMVGSVSSVISLGWDVTAGLGAAALATGGYALSTLPFIPNALMCSLPVFMQGFADCSAN